MNEYCLTVERKFLHDSYATWEFADLIVIPANTAAQALQSGKEAIGKMRDETKEPFKRDFRIVKIEKV